MKKIMVIAHRGGRAGVHENRIETIKDTIKKSYVDAIEVDLRVTSDNILVINHDRGVIVNGKKVWIDTIVYDSIKHLGIPTFEEVASLFMNSEKILNIDVKDEKCVIPLKDFITKKKFTKKFYLDCFNLDLLLELQEELPTGEYFLSLNPKDSFDFNKRFVVRVLILLVTIFFSQLIVYILKRKIKKVSINGISIYHKFAGRRFIKDLQSFGFKVFVWGTDREFQIQKFISYGVDGIITKNISIFEKII